VLVQLHQQRFGVGGCIRPSIAGRLWSTDGTIAHPDRGGDIAMNTQLRATGIGVVGDVPWGTHFFLFHETKEDLIDTVIPYFKAGLEGGEFCVWVVSDPLTEGDVESALRRSIPGFDGHLRRRSIEILQGRLWYMTGEDLDLERVARGWNDKVESALSRGYSGFRLSAGTAWLEKKDWKSFCEYEAEVNGWIGDKPMIALCTYPLVGSAAAEILDVARTHQFAVARRNRQWEIVETSELKRAKAEIQKLNDELEQRVAERTRELVITNEELRREMNERQRAEQALMVAQAELAHVARVTAMGELAASIAHEIAQPLTGMVTNGNACMHWLSAAPPNLARAKGTVERIIRDGDRASEVIHEIRALVTKDPPQKHPVDIKDLIHKTIALTAGEMTRMQVELQTDLADLPPALGDRVQLQQVLLNLILNALEAMMPVVDRPRKLTIQSQRHASPDGVLISVQDSGIGLDPQQARKVFDAFFTTKPQGMGMGLSICRTIISAHGGMLTAAGNVDHGATFQFTVPAARMEASEKGGGRVVNRELSLFQ
jgi:signal transduction histidine kinase